MMVKVASQDVAAVDSLELEKMTFEHCCHSFGRSDLEVLSLSLVACMQC